MANTKNFKVNSGIQPAVYHENVGTASTGTAAVGYNLAGASYDSVSFDISGQEGGAFGLAFNNDGTKMYVTGYTSDAINQYSLSTAFDISTASYDSVQFSFLSQDTTPISAMFNNDGTKIYVVGRTNLSIFQYSLSTAFDVSTTSYDSVSFSVSSQDSSPYNLDFNSDGTKMYMVGDTNNAIYQYSLSSGFDLSTASYDSVSLTVTSQDGSPYGIRFKSDGTKLYMIGTNNKTIYQYSLTTAFDLSTASYDSVSFSVSSQENLPTNLVFNNNGTKMYVVGYSGDNVYQYTTSSTIAAKTLDMSTGTVFEITPTADTQIGLSNPAASGTVSQATLLLSAGNTGFDLTGAQDTGQSWAFSSSGSGPLSYNNDGTKLYVMDWSTGPVREYTLSTAYDISTATLNYTWTPTSYSGAAYRGMSMCRSGTRLYLMDDNSSTSAFIIRQFNLSTAFDLSTASTSQNSSVTRSETSTAYGMANDETFTNIYIIKNDKTILQYALGGSSDVSAITYTGSTLYSGLTSTPRQGALSSDGTKLLITGQNAQLDMLTFSTAYDSTTGTVTTYAMTTAGLPSANYYGLAASPDLSYATVAEINTEVIYNLSLDPLATITYDSSIQWGGGTAPDSPAANETDVVTFTTRDGGTTYQGILAIDGAK